jgi:alanine dehydrogenase
MLVLTAQQTRTFAPMSQIIEGLRQAFSSEHIAPPRQIAKVPGGSGERLFLAMSAFDVDGAAAVKLVSVFPDNAPRGLPTIQASVIAFSNEGTPIAVLDGTTITHVRTGAASALASSYLSREDSSRLVIVGTGALAPAMAEAHCAVRSFRQVTICGRRLDRVQATVQSVRKRIDPSIEVVPADSIEDAARGADVISCCTSSPFPVLKGVWLKSGTFVDLVGSFSPSKRESDDDVVRHARIFVDTFEGAFSEAGDILDPLARGVIGRDRVEGELKDLVLERATGRKDPHETIVFKSVGTAIEDLAAARIIISNAMQASASP